MLKLMVCVNFALAMTIGATDLSCTIMPFHTLSTCKLIRLCVMIQCKPRRKVDTCLFFCLKKSQNFMTVWKHSWCGGCKKANTFSGHSVPHTPSPLFAGRSLLDLYCLSIRSIHDWAQDFFCHHQNQGWQSRWSDEKRQIRFRNILFLIPAPFCLLDVPYWTSIWTFYYLYNF